MTPYSKSDDQIAVALATPGWYEKRVQPRLVVDANGCWVWSASLSHGYAQVALPGRDGKQACVRVSRVVWMRLRGEIPARHVLDHDGPEGCSNKACANPDHLQAVTQRHNSVVTGHGFTAINSRKQVCPEGHPLTGDNVMPSMAARGRRSCLTCSHENNRRRNEAVRDAAALLGLAVTVYARDYGWSRRTAEQVIRERRQVAA
jgi:hypothetical protein